MHSLRLFAVIILHLAISVNSAPPLQQLQSGSSIVNLIGDESLSQISESAEASNIKQEEIRAKRSPQLLGGVGAALAYEAGRREGIREELEYEREREYLGRRRPYLGGRGGFDRGFYGGDRDYYGSGGRRFDRDFDRRRAGEHGRGPHRRF